MNQAITPVGVAAIGRPGPLSDAPDLLYVIRRHLWLIILGTVLGFALGTGGYFLKKKYDPQYTAERRYEVRILANPVDPASSPAPSMNSDDLTRFIRNQSQLVKSDPVLAKSAKTEAIKGTQWFRDNRDPTDPDDVKDALKKQVDVSPVVGTSYFVISMSGRDRVEITAIVNAVGDTYYQELQNDTQSEAARATAQLTTARDNLQNQINVLKSQLDDFRGAHDIPAITQTYTIVLGTLSTLTADVMKAESDSAQARDQFKTIQKQVTDNSLQLSADMEQYVQNDPTIRSLEANLLSLEQERAVAMISGGEQSAQVRIIDVRMGEIRKQRDETLDRLRGQARARMGEAAQNILSAAEAREKDLRARQDRQDRLLKDLDRNLLDYRNRNQQLENQQKVLDELNHNLTMADLRKGADATRIRPYPAAAPPGPNQFTSPDAKLYLPLGTLAGLALSFLLAYVMELTNTRVRTPRDITRTMQLPLLGFVPDQQDDQFLDGDLNTSIRTSPGSLIAESFRQIRGRLTAYADGQPMRSLLIASISPGGGATTVASNMANGIALNGQRVLLVDANFYRPGLKNCYKNIPATGLSDILANGAKVEDTIVPSTDMPSLHLMGAGSRPATSTSELLETRGFRDLLATLQERYDVVIFDGAPLSLVADSISLGAKVDGVIGVVRAGAISRGTVVRVRDQLRLVKANLVGVVLNAARTHGAGYFKENYRTFYRYAGPVAATTVRASATAGSSPN